MSRSAGWRRQFSVATIAREEPGLPEEGGPFARLCVALRNYQFSDPSIVTAHFDPAHPFEGRRMLLEIRILGLRILTGTLIGAVSEERSAGTDQFGFRYETLEGHIEAGYEWFMIRKDHATGEIRFSIEARWRMGEFPNAWSRLGFHLLARPMQKRWHRRAHRRMSLLSRFPVEELRSRGGRIAHEGPRISFDFE
ncbi:MAG: DUF1990 family protein [Candidatus Krumholzibacteriia bacterium]